MLRYEPAGLPQPPSIHTRIGSGIAQFVHVLRIPVYRDLTQTAITRNLQAGFALAADLLITAALCYRLRNNKGQIQSTNRILNYLIVTAINRGALVMFLAALNIVLFTSKPGTFYFLAMMELSGKVYMNSMLASLNTRPYAVSLGRRGTDGGVYVSSGSAPPSGSRPGGGGGPRPIPMPSEVIFQKHTYTHTDEPFPQSTKADANANTHELSFMHVESRCVPLRWEYI
ncbi:Saposin B-type domain-containing protein [Mycena kentingensis (nom. inval.)]|nr:Saposin B-type domain-containing protein [Mycena kentingensis (nom. inval.)]